MLAQTTAPASTQGWGEALKVGPMGFMMVALVVMYLFIFKTKKNQDKERKKLLENLAKGDRIQTIGGILGTVIEAREGDVLVKVDESNNTKIRFSRSAIHRVLEDGKADNTAK